MSKSVSSAFYEALQQDNVEVVELITLTTKTTVWRWAALDKEIVRSGNYYYPFPGQTLNGLEAGIDMGLSTIDFVLINSGGAFNELLNASDLDMASVLVHRVLINSPDLGFMEMYIGKLADYSYNRRTITGQARDNFNSNEVQFPYYTYMDQCAWRFGSPGCAFDTSSITIVGSLAASTADRLAVAVTSGEVSSYAPGKYDKGRLTFTSGSNSGQIRTVRISSGNILQISHQIPYDVVAGDMFALFPGCKKRLIEDCVSTYNNASNFLGFPWIPKQERAF